MVSGSTNQFPLGKSHPFIINIPLFLIRDFQLAMMILWFLVVSHILSPYSHCISIATQQKSTPKVVMSHGRTTVLSGGYWNFSLDILPPFSKSPSLNEAPSHLENLARSEGAATKTSGHQGHGWLPGEADHEVSMEHPPSHDSVVSNWGYKAIYKWDPRIRDLLTKVVSYSLGWSWKVHQRELWRTTPRILTGMHHQVDRSW